MSDVTDADQDKALQLTGCELDPHPGGPFCRAHDEDGNPPWDRCRWVPVAYALAEERRKAREAFLALADKLDEVAPEFGHAARLSNDSAAVLVERAVHSCATTVRNFAAALAAEESGE